MSNQFPMRPPTNDNREVRFLRTQPHFAQVNEQIESLDRWRNWFNTQNSDMAELRGDSTYRHVQDWSGATVLREPRQASRPYYYYGNPQRRLGQDYNQVVQQQQQRHQQQPGQTQYRLMQRRRRARIRLTRGTGTTSTNPEGREARDRRLRVVNWATVLRTPTGQRGDDDARDLYYARPRPPAAWVQALADRPGAAGTNPTRLVFRFAKPRRLMTTLRYVRSFGVGPPYGGGMGKVDVYEITDARWQDGNKRVKFCAKRATGRDPARETAFMRMYRGKPHIVQHIRSSHIPTIERGDLPAENLDWSRPYYHFMMEYLELGSLDDWIVHRMRNDRANQGAIWNQIPTVLNDPRPPLRHMWSYPQENGSGYRRRTLRYPDKALWQIFEGLSVGLVEMKTPHRNRSGGIFSLPNNVNEDGNMIHGDLDATNVFNGYRDLTQNDDPTQEPVPNPRSGPDVKIGDFGLSMDPLTEFTLEQDERLKWQFLAVTRISGKAAINGSPEKFHKDWEDMEYSNLEVGTIAGNFGAHTNVYQVGKTMWTMITGARQELPLQKAPVPGTNPPVLSYGCVLERVTEFRHAHEDRLRHLVLECMAERPADRPTADELVQRCRQRLAEYADADALMNDDDISQNEWTEEFWENLFDYPQRL